MIEFDLLGPGPSACLALADRLRGRRVGVVNNAFELAPWADFLAAADRAWWLAYPAALQFEGARYSGNMLSGVQQLAGVETNWCSGVLGLEAAASHGAELIRLHGFDMHGSHFFGRYDNGLRNTEAKHRRTHCQQFAHWAAAHPHVQVINCTPGSQLLCFPFELEQP